MKTNIHRIYYNAQKSLYTDINGNSDKWNISYVSVRFLIPIVSALIVYFNSDSFIDDPKIIATLLSLFSGLMFGVLIKIPDKFKDLESKEFESRLESTKKKQVKNYLKLFMYSLSYSILVALFSIFFVLLSSLFPSLTKLDLTKYGIDWTFKNFSWLQTSICFVVVSFRFLLIIFILNFVFFILKAVSNLYEFMLYEFKKIK